MARTIEALFAAIAVAFVGLCLLSRRNHNNVSIQLLRRSPPRSTESTLIIDDYLTISKTNADSILLTILCVSKCESSSDDSCRHYQTPMETCFHGPRLFPNDPSWNATAVDILDVPLNQTHFQRHFYATNEQCQGNPTDGFVLPFHIFVGPFGAPRPWGMFQLLSSSSSSSSFVTLSLVVE